MDMYLVPEIIKMKMTPKNQLNQIVNIFILMYFLNLSKMPKKKLCKKRNTRFFQIKKKQKNILTKTD